MANPSKPWSNPPDHAHQEWINWVTSQLNQLQAQQYTSSLGLPSVQNNTINPTGTQISSSGNRVASVTSEIRFDAGGGGSTQITFAWDGVNIGSQVFQILRTDVHAIPGEC